MASAHRTILALAAFMLLPCAAAEQAQVYFLKFPVADTASSGQIDKVVVTVSCSWVAALRNVPELYNITMGYEIPTENILEATPRLGAAAVDLSRWNGVIGVRVPGDADARSCFEVKVRVVIREDAKGREDVERQWTGAQL